jgi:hypothetical protein
MPYRFPRRNRDEGEGMMEIKLSEDEIKEAVELYTSNKILEKFEGHTVVSSELQVENGQYIAIIKAETSEG